MCFTHISLCPDRWLANSDACVPYKGNQEWIKSLVKGGTLSESEAWRPWYNDLWPHMPAGYVTSYNVTGATHGFHFLTIRLAGHMVPTFQPQVHEQSAVAPVVYRGLSERMLVLAGRVRSPSSAVSSPASPSNRIASDDDVVIKGGRHISAAATQHILGRQPEGASCV